MTEDMANRLLSGKIKSVYELNRDGSDFVRIDEVENAIDYLESCLLFFPRTDSLKWKWIGFSVAQSLYSFCILNLDSSNPISLSQEDDNDVFYKREGMVRWRKSKKIKLAHLPGYKIEWDDTEKEPGGKAPSSAEELIDGAVRHMDRNLLGFWSALARVQDSEHWMKRYYGSHEVKISDPDLVNIGYLYEAIRNDVVHFRPKLMRHHIPKIKECCMSTILVIEDLAFKTGSLFLDKQQNERIRSAIESIKREVK
jgi:hypothetical protein